MVERIFELMKERKINGKQLAFESGMSKGIVTDWRTGRSKPSAEALIKLAEYFNVSIDYLCGLTDDRAPIGGDSKKKQARRISRRRCGIAA